MFIYLIVAAMLGLIPAYIADSKGHNFLIWWIYGSALFIVAFIHSLFLKSPEEEAFRQQQKQFMEDVASGKANIHSANKRTSAKSEISANATPESLIKRAFLFIEDKNWDYAYAYCEAALDAEPEMAEAYLGKLLAEYEVSEKSELVNCAQPFDGNDDYKKLLRFGSKELIDELNGYIEQIKERNERNRAEVERRAEEKRIEADRKAEAERLEAERKAEEKRIKTRRSVKKLKKVTVIVLPIIAVIVVVMVIFMAVIKPKMDYNVAVELMDKGQYEEAIIAFTAIGDYKDSIDQIDKCNKMILDKKYNAAIAFMRIGEYYKAISAFTAVGDYKDSVDQIDKCKLAMLDGKYNDAISLMSIDVIQAYEELVALNGYKDSTEKANSIYKEYKVEKIKATNVGGCVFFGAYEQDNNTSNGKEDIEWLVLEKEDNKALIISKYALDCKPYNTSYTDVTWETCSLREWLNNDFINATFTADEKSMIPAVTVSADKNPSYSTNPGDATQDQVFLLSITEEGQYKIQCKPTDYAVANGAYVSSDNGYCWWWLRSPGIYQNYAASVFDAGFVDVVGNYVDSDYYAVRPALWIDLSTNE